jgi:hypothetical protein
MGNGIRIPQVTRVQRCPAADEFLRGGEVSREDVNTVSTGQQSERKAPTEESGGARHQHFHRRPVLMGAILIG